MSTQTLGKVSITPKGNWSAATTYAALDAVRDSGNGYLAIKASTNVPTSNTEYWMKLVDKGNTGEAAGFGTPTATVTGLPAGSAPTVSIDASGTDVEKIFAFAFGIPKGDTGVGISGIEKTSTAGLVDTYTVTYTDGTTATFTVTNGEDGDDGTAAGFGTPTATIDSSVGTPTVTISASGPDTGKVFSFEFHNLKGATGNGIASIAKTSTVGNTDTYTITMTDGTASTFNVRNAKNVYVQAAEPENWENGDMWLDTDATAAVVTVDQSITQGSTNPVAGGAIYETIVEVNTIAWENKTITNATGEIKSSNTRIITVPTNALISIKKITNNIRLFVYAWDENGEYVGYCINSEYDFAKSGNIYDFSLIKTAEIINNHPGYTLRFRISKLVDTDPISASDAYTYVSTESIKPVISYENQNAIDMNSILYSESVESIDANKFVWEHGKIDTAGVETDDNTRIRTVGFYAAQKGTVVTCDSGYSYTLILYSEPRKNSVIGNRPISSDSYEFLSNCYYRISIKKNDGSALIDTEAGKHIHITGYDIMTRYINSGWKRQFARTITSTVTEKYQSGSQLEPHHATTGNLASMYGKWDALADLYPNNITKTNLGKDSSGVYDIYQYVIKGNTDDTKYKNVYIKQPHNLKVLWFGTIHGNETIATRDDYVFFKELCDNHETDDTLGLLWDNVTFVVVPICNPWGYENLARWNSNLVNLNRNFNARWTYVSHDDDPNNYSGESAGSETETQILCRVISNNEDAFIMVNRHSAGTFQDIHVFGYVTSIYKTDREVARASFREITTLIRKEFQWIANDSNNLTHSLVAARDASSKGTLDLYFNELGHHGFLLELGTVEFGALYPTATALDRQKIDVLIMGNLMRSLAMQNQNILSSDQIEVMTYV